jgi:hypothetical protein
LLLFWREGEPLSPKTIQVKVTDGFDVKTIEAASSLPEFTVRVETIKPGSDYQVIVTPKNPHTKARIEIKSDCPTTGSKVFTAFARAG